METIRSFNGLRPVSSKSSSSSAASNRATGSCRQPLQVVAQKKVLKKAQVVLLKDIQGVGVKGELTSVASGYFRNYLNPQGLACFADERILDDIRKEEERKEAARQKVKAEAQMLATALSTIGKFTIKKKCGDSKTKLFGSVTAQDVVEAVKMQTTQTLDKKIVDCPEIREAGTYTVRAKLHPEVVAEFKLVVKGVHV